METCKNVWNGIPSNPTLSAFCETLRKVANLKRWFLALCWFTMRSVCHGPPKSSILEGICFATYNNFETRWWIWIALLLDLGLRSDPWKSSIELWCEDSNSLKMLRLGWFWKSIQKFFLVLRVSKKWPIGSWQTIWYSLRTLGPSKSLTFDRGPEVYKEIIRSLEKNSSAVSDSGAKTAKWYTWFVFVSADRRLSRRPCEYSEFTAHISQTINERVPFIIFLGCAAKGSPQSHGEYCEIFIVYNSGLQLTLVSSMAKPLDQSPWPCKSSCIFVRLLVRSLKFIKRGKGWRGCALREAEGILIPW